MRWLSVLAFALSLAGCGNAESETGTSTSGGELDAGPQVPGWAFSIDSELAFFPLLPELLGDGRFVIDVSFGTPGRRFFFPLDDQADKVPVQIVPNHVDRGINLSPEDVLWIGHGTKGDKVFGHALDCSGKSCLFLSRVGESNTKWTLEPSLTDGFGALTREVAFNADRIVAVGDLQGTLEFGSDTIASGDDGTMLFAIALTPDGAPLWAKPLATLRKQDTLNADSVALGADGRTLASGVFSGDFTPSVDSPTTTHGTGGHLTVFDAAGDVVFTKTWTGAQADAAQGTAVFGEEGAIYVSGRFKDSLDLGAGAIAGGDGVSTFVAKLASDGTPAWTFVGEGFGARFALAFDDEHRIWAGGRLAHSTKVGDFTLELKDGSTVLLEFDEQGKVRSAKQFPGGESFTGICGLRPAPEGSLIAVGAAAEGIDFGHGPLPGMGIFAARIFP